MIPLKHLAGAAVIASALGLASSTACSQSAWLPPEGRFQVTPSYVYQSFQTFWMGTHRTKLSDPVVQHSATISMEYGVAESFALDAAVGYSRVDSKAFGPTSLSDDGLSDTRLGLRWRIVDERMSRCAYAPTVTLRVGGIIAGSYEAGPPFAPGDGAHGGEFSVLAAKAFGSTGFGLYGEGGYRIRSRPVPDDAFASIGAYQTLGAFTLHVAYQHTQGLSGSDIGDPGFKFPELKEVNQIVEIGLGFTDSGKRYYQIFGALNVGGRNTGDKQIIGASASFPF